VPENSIDFVSFALSASAAAASIPAGCPQATVAAMAARPQARTLFLTISHSKLLNDDPNASIRKSLRSIGEKSFRLVLRLSDLSQTPGNLGDEPRPERIGAAEIKKAEAALERVQSAEARYGFENCAWSSVAVCSTFVMTTSVVCTADEFLMWNGTFTPSTSR